MQISVWSTKPINQSEKMAPFFRGGGREKISLWTIQCPNSERGGGRGNVRKKRHFYWEPQCLHIVSLYSRPHSSLKLSRDARARSKSSRAASSRGARALLSHERARLTARKRDFCARKRVISPHDVGIRTLSFARKESSPIFFKFYTYMHISNVQIKYALEKFANIHV